MTIFKEYSDFLPDMHSLQIENLSGEDILQLAFVLLEKNRSMGHEIHIQSE